MMIPAPASPVRDQDDVDTIERVPLAERGLPDSTVSMIEQAAERYPERTALQFFVDGRRYKRYCGWRFSELIGRIRQTANLFHELGVGPRDVVSCVLPNLPETHFVLWGAEATGVVNPINPLLEPNAMARLMDQAGTRVVVTLAPTPGTDIYARVRRAVEQVPAVERVLLVDVAAYTGSLAGMALRWQARRASGRGRDYRLFRDALDAQPDQRWLSRRPNRRDEPASLFHTGGTTGAPKIAVRTHGNEVYNAWAGSRVNGIDDSYRVLCALPLFHAHAALILGLMPWSLGSSVVLATPSGFRDPAVIERFWEIVDHFGINAFSAVPTVFGALLDRDIGAAAGRVRVGFCGAAPLPAAVHRRFERTTGIPVVEGYGLTEATCISSVNPRAGERVSGSVGLRLPYQAMAVAELDGEGHVRRFCDNGELGEILVAGPNVFAGYLDERHNAGVWACDNDGRRWLVTGDRGRRDTRGYFHLVGRSKDLIIRGGHNIDPAIIEEALSDHPDVAEVAAVGRPDGHAGEVPVAYLTARPGARPESDALVAHAAARIAERPAQPQAVRVVDALPVTAVGKIFKPELRRREAEAACRERLEADGETGWRLRAEWTEAGIEIRVQVAGQDRVEWVKRALAPLTGSFTLRVESGDPPS